VQATTAPPLSTPRPAPARARSARAETLVWALASALLLAVVAISVERKVTWYLAVDQYGYLTFANDLVHGKVFHDWPLLGAIGSRLPDRIDVLSQTYVYDSGRVYCRYAPGFPLLLAGWMRVFGANAAHALNPLVFLALLGLALAYQARAFGDRWRALAGTTLIVLCPTFLHLWALTLVRDLAAHLAGVAGLFLVLPIPGRPRALTPLRTAAAGLAIGYAASIRPDAVIYVVPAVLIAVWQWLRAGLPASRVIAALGAGALSVVIGLAPFLGFNYLATGNPLRPTQGMELDSLLPTPPETAAAPAPATGAGRVGYPSLGWTGGTKYGVQGGGVRLSNFRHTLPGNIALLRGAYGDTLLAFAVLGALLAMVLHPALFLTAVPYCVLALLVFSFWSRPDGRYLSGVFVFIPMLVVEGVFGPAALLARMARRARPGAAVGVGIAVAAALGAAALVPPVAPAGALPILTVVVPLAAALAALAATLPPGRGLAAWAAPALALGLVVLIAARALGGEQRRATFQRAQMERARATLAEAVRPGALVITTEDVGRPAENIDYYSGVARAVYLTDLMRWRLSPTELALRAARSGLTPYLLLPVDQPDRAELFDPLLRVYGVTLVADIPPERAIDYFVAAAFHRGVHMQLHRIDVPPGIFETWPMRPRR
jgi:hypothetical protein